ncbi:hypothetical protein BDU57DRAFT_409696, partial [Ampelomyces quisqualis]
MQHFATQLSGTQQTTHSLRARQCRPRRKRRRGDHHHDSPSPGPEPPAASRAWPETAQLRVAGLLSGDTPEPPPAPFPHAPARVAKEPCGPGKLQEEIAHPPSRLYAVSALSARDSLSRHGEATSLRKTHLNVLSTLMHRCLLEGDYERAGRAWGMLLRTHVAGGHPVDPRNHGRWGIGAEILLRREHNDQSVSPELFSQQGFALAREYFDRLIVQHPNRKPTPNAVDERTFYPAMFSLWILETCEKKDSIMHHDRDAPGMRAREDAIQIEELARATEIAERLDQLISSPPFDKQASLLHLRGHVSLWVSALLLDKATDDENSDMDVTYGTHDGDA